ncbi:nonribosomal peptide synthase, partial [Aspergillus sclerotialis]
MLSVLMAGGGFLPLDPSHPTSRHEEILAEVNASILLCSPHYSSRYSKAVKTVIPINRDTVKAYGALNQNARVPDNTTSSNTAYILFTSGSTGRAKGITIENGALASSVMAFGPMVHLDSAPRVFQFASLTFDAAMLEIFATLLFGGCICVPSEDERLNDVA